MGKHKKWSSLAKFEIALLALKGEVSINEICKKYEVAPSQVHSWKKQLLDRGKEIFTKSDKAKKMADEQAKQEKVLFEKIGQLTVERDFLKKAWSKLHGDSD